MGKRKRDDSDQNSKSAKNARSFSQKWLQLFLWLRFDSMLNAMFCDICQKHKLKNNFVKPGSTNFRKSAVVEHANSNDHVQALKLETASKSNPIVSVFEKVHEKTDNAMCTLFRNAYFIAKENLPMDKFQSLNDLNKSNGAVITSKLYQENNACSEFIQIISDSIEQEVMSDVKLSPAGGIMIDESTDLATQKHLILYLSYLKAGELKISYTKLLNLSSGTAVSITAHIIAYLKSFGVDLSKIFGMGSDGASVMIGKHGGVSQLLKDTSPHLVEVHCVAHRLALACVDTAKEIPDIQFLESIVSTVYSYYKHSPTNLAELRSWQLIIDDPLFNPLDIHKVRWLSMGNALDNLRRSVVSIVNMLGDQTDTDIVANSLHNSMTTYKFFFMLYFLSDLFGKINQLSKSLQKRDLSYATVKQLVDSFLMAIEAEYLTELPSFGPLCTEFLKSTEQSDTFKTITFQRNHRDIHLKKRAVQCAQLIHDNIRDRFPDNKIFEAFSVFEPSNFPSSVADLPRYGEQQLECLGDHYNLINQEELQVEWGILKYLIFNNYKGLSFADLLTAIISRKDQFPNAISLMEISRILPVSSVECERGFSRQNIIKTKLRCSLGIDSLDQLMRISLVGVDVKDFDPVPAIRKWQSVRNRHVYQNNAFSKLMNVRS
ncbi:Hypothetical predicted protein [Mytilus galloprovincialis]|uniref:C17orf113 probable zinc finger domain-containing protein n=1 Tax=Mytilus galloprovincialis TaxID=29158 RepID=A0A8B6H8G0_MYTGA|nr:Hypothetical predicted protein [Mytilus galloprovincialis]